MSLGWLVWALGRTCVTQNTWINIKKISLWARNTGVQCQEDYTVRWLAASLSSCFSSSQFSSVSQSCPTLCDPVDCSMPGLPVHHPLPELAEAHVLRVHDAIQLSHLLLIQGPAVSKPNLPCCSAPTPQFTGFCKNKRRSRLIDHLLRITSSYISSDLMTWLSKT